MQPVAQRLTQKDDATDDILRVLNEAESLLQANSHEAAPGFRSVEMDVCASSTQRTQRG
jgi:hypothetical protein